MFCTSCGKKLEDNAKFCGFCGATLEDVTQDDAPPTYSDNQKESTQNPPLNTGQNTAPANFVGGMPNAYQNVGYQPIAPAKDGLVSKILGFCGVGLMVISYFVSCSFYDLSQFKFYIWAMAIGGFLAGLWVWIVVSMDLIITKENSTRNVRLIIIGSFSGLSTLLYSLSYIDPAFTVVNQSFIQQGLEILGSILIVVAGIIGLCKKNKPKFYNGQRGF